MTYVAEWLIRLRSEYSLMHGAMGLFEFSYPAAQLSHCRRVTPPLQGHCPVFWSQTFPIDP